MAMEGLTALGAAAGSWGAFADSYRSTMPAIYRYLYRGTAGDVHLAEELTQATFEIAARGYGQGRLEALEPAWLQSVARSRLIDHYRRTGRERSKLTRIAGRRECHPGPMGDHQAPESLAALKVLEPQHRVALVLRYVDDLTVADVAGLLGKSVRATESLLVRARAALRVAYEEQCDAP